MTLPCSWQFCRRITLITVLTKYHNLTSIDGYFVFGAKHQTEDDIQSGCLKVMAAHVEIFRLPLTITAHALCSERMHTFVI